MLKRIGMALALVTLMGCSATTSEAGPRYHGGYHGSGHHGHHWGHRQKKVYGHSGRHWGHGKKAYGKAGPQRSVHRVDRRQGNHVRRIERGLDRGTLNRHEAQKLWKQQRKINRLERRFGRDGHYSKKERRILEKKQDRASRKIKRFRNNDRDRGYGGGHRQHRGGRYARN